MKNRRVFGPKDTMCELIENDNRVLLIMSCLGIKLGIGDKTIGEVCKEANVDAGTFLVVVNTAIDGDDPNELDISNVSIQALLDGLTGTHRYYLGLRFPEIRSNLILAWGDLENDLLKVMIRYYDELVECLREHVALEERTIFACARSLAGKGIRDRKCDGVPLQRNVHEPIMARLAELRRLLIRYYPAHDTHRMNDVILELQSCESVMKMHNKVEEVLLARMMAQLGKDRDKQTAKAVK